MTLDVNSISNFDYIIAGIVAVFLLRGLCIGFVRQLAATAALVGSYWLAAEYTGEVIPHVQQLIARPGAVFFLSFGGLFLLFALLITLIGQLLQKVLEVTLLGWADRLAGGLLGAVRGALVVTLLFMFLAAVLPSGHPFFADSLTVPYLTQGAELVRQVIRDVKVRDDLKPLPPEQEKKKAGQQLPAPAVDKKLEQKPALPVSTQEQQP